MPVREGREYRTFDFALEAKDDYVVEGYATTFDDPYPMPGGIYEVIDRHALDEADMSDAIYQVDHKGAVLARRSNGSLEIACDDHGLFFRAKLGGSQAGRDHYEAVSSGLYTRMSWGFTVVKGTEEYNVRAATVTVKKVRKVYDVSAVSFPANSGTEIHARSYLDGVIEQARGESARREREMEEREALAALASIL
ncbi:HK97 family phage prohead protease [Adlercreutzia caecimuris]|uniref:HK97 family phage prohead protease n=1 Tax=Adlercreutzia caecimuris TaxID=671266 RepID=UPI00258F5E09|nr:HK97 family phage prohead protease [Adlercreutzia caecimuris]